MPAAGAGTRDISSVTNTSSTTRCSASSELLPEAHVVA